MKKALLITLAIVVGVPVLAVAGLITWTKLSDRTTATILSSGEQRRFLLHVPPGYRAAHPVPLVISLHPAAGWPHAQASISRWNDLADRDGFIVVYPSGGGSRGPHIWRPKSDVDVRFVADLLDTLEARYAIDQSRVFVNGYSQGGGMTFVLSCRLASRIAAVAQVAAAEERAASSCGDSTPMPLVAFHGTLDHMVPYAGGKSGDPVNPITFPPVRVWAAQWAARDGCAKQPAETRVAPHVTRSAWDGCRGGSQVILYTVEGGGHTWPGSDVLPRWFVGSSTHEIDATALMWDFFQRHPKPSGDQQQLP